MAAGETSRLGEEGPKVQDMTDYLPSFLQGNPWWGHEHTQGLTLQWLDPCQIQGCFLVLVSWTWFCIWKLAFEARLLVLCFSSDISSNILLVPLQKPLPLLSPVGFSLVGVFSTLFFVSIHTP